MIKIIFIWATNERECTTNSDISFPPPWLFSVSPCLRGGFWFLVVAPSRCASVVGFAFCWGPEREHGPTSSNFFASEIPLVTSLGIFFRRIHETPYPAC